MSTKDLTLPRHILQGQRAHPEARGDFTALLTQISLACKVIAREIGQAALAGTLGATGAVNVQGEQVKKLDVLTNEIMVEALEESGLVCTLVSEEMDEPLHLSKACERAKDRKSVV